MSAPTTTLATVEGIDLAQSLIAELCNADLGVRSPHVRLYRRGARVWGPDDVIDGGRDCYDDCYDEATA